VKNILLCGSWLIVSFLLSGCTHHPDTIETCNDKTRIQICFTPGQDCTAMLVDAINAAQNDIEVQAYSFTSYPIAKALVSAKNRGVHVVVILDKSQFVGPYFSESKYLYQHNINLYEDSDLNIAHNKIMIFDKKITETGSFNFTRAAQNKNAENMLIIHNPSIASAYLKNLEKRKKASKTVTEQSFQN